MLEFVDITGVCLSEHNPRPNDINNPEDIEVPEEVKVAAIQGRLCFFIGNGVSRLYGLPSWNELADEMLFQLFKNKKINFSQYDVLKDRMLREKMSIASKYFKDNLSDLKKEDLTYRYLLGGQNFKRNEVGVYDALAKCGNYFITTNYDSLLWEVLRYNKPNQEPSEKKNN